MADSVKKQFMDALAGAFQAIQEVGSVHRWHGTSFDLETVKPPVLFYWDVEEKRDRRNRLALGTVHLMVWVFIPLSPKGTASFHDRADQIQGQLHNVLTSTPALKGLVQGFEELKVDKDFPNDQWGLLSCDFNLTYGHAYGNAFSTAY